MPIPELPLVTDRLELRYFEKSDLDCVAEYYALPEVQRYLEDRKSVV